MLLADYICDDLRARIRAGQEPPAPLTLQELSTHYGVSLTPVRQAIERLVDEKILQRNANRRLAVRSRRKSNSKRKARLPEPPPADEPYRQIARRVIEMSLAGDEEFLREEKTADEYGVSRAVIRRVFSRLEGEGLINHLPRRGWQVHPFRQDDLDAFTQIRAALEREALSLAWPRIDADRIREMLEANRPADGDDRLDNSLHAYLIETADNHYIRDFFERHGRYYALLFEWEALDASASANAARQHREILQAVLDTDLPEATRLLDEHIRHSHPVLEQLLASVRKQPKRSRRRPK